MGRERHDRLQLLTLNAANNALSVGGPPSDTLLLREMRARPARLALRGEAEVGERAVAPVVEDQPRDLTAVDVE